MRPLALALLAVAALPCQPQEIYDLIDRLAAGGKAVLVVSSYLPELLGLCDRIQVMYRGVLSAPWHPAERVRRSGRVTTRSSPR